MAVFARPRERAAQSRPAEKRIAQLAFLAPPIGARINAVQELYGIGSADLANRHDTVWACRDLIASMMGMLQPWAFRLPGTGVPTPTPGPGMGAAGTPVKVPNQPVILNEPSADMDIGDFLYAGTFALSQGNVYGAIVNRDRLGYPSQIELQDNSRVQVRKLADGSKEVKFGGQVQDPASVWHKAIFRPPGSLTGLSVIQAAHRAMTLGVNAEDFGNGFFEEGAHPSAILTNEKAEPGEIDEGDAQTIKQKFLAAVHGSREPVVMGGGWKYQQVQVNPHDSQFIDTMGISSLKVCRYFRVWPEMVSVTMQGQNVTYANVEQRALDFLTYTMNRWIVWWERKLGALLPAGQYVKFDLSPLLRTDILTRWTVNHAMIASRIMTQDEVRSGEDLPPLTPEQKAEINAVPLQPALPPLTRPASGE
jgi:HK97 family phage portal protein